MKVIWSPKATQDLSRIVAIIARDKKKAALQWAQTVYRKVSRLRLFPKSGRTLPELAQLGLDQAEAGQNELREVIVGNYRIVYKVTTQISILTVFHGAKKF